MTTTLSQLKENLNRRSIQYEYFPDNSSLLKWLSKKIQPNSVVGVGDSATLEESGILAFLRSSSIHFLDKYKEGITKEEKQLLYRKNFSADVFFLGANAISLTGEVVQIDGNGSRVAPMIYGPKKVYIIAGTNKITSTLEEAQKRARQIAGPLDAKRLRKETPCAITGQCINCQSPDRICNHFVTLSGQFDPQRITVCIIEGSFGF